MIYGNLLRVVFAFPVLQNVHFWIGTRYTQVPVSLNNFLRPPAFLMFQRAL